MALCIVLLLPPQRLKTGNADFVSQLYTCVINRCGTCLSMHQMAAKDGGECSYNSVRVESQREYSNSGTSTIKERCCLYINNTFGCKSSDVNGEEFL